MCPQDTAAQYLPKSLKDLTYFMMLFDIKPSNVWELACES